MLEVTIMKKSFWKKMLTTALAACMTLSVAFAGNAYAAEETDTLNATMNYLVEECGPRLAATPNEDKAAAYIKAQFESFGYTDVEWAKPVKNGGYTGKLTFSDGSADIYGNCYPNNPTNGTFDKITAPLVNVGTAEEVVLPEGVTGDIIAAATFTGSLNTALLNSVVEQIAAINADVTVKGLLLAKADSIKVTSAAKADRDALNKSSIPCVVTTQYLLDKAIDKADKLVGVERYELANTNAVIATKPAATDDPDAIIIVSAHMDSVIAAPGASDNATGSAALVELAKIFSTVDNGNIKLIFASVGSEESGGMLGTQYVISTLTPEEKAIAINLNMDMLGAIQPAVGNAPLNAVSMDIYCPRGTALTLNLPAYLVTNGAKDITWAEGIENVRIFKYGASDHQVFQQAGIDAASMIVVTDEDDEIETINHSSADTLENNYSYDRLKMCTALMANGIQTAIDKQLSKKAEILFAETADGYTAELVNGAQLFKLYDKVEVTLTAEDAATETLTFAADVLTQAVAADPAACTIAAVGSGTGIADNKNAERNEGLKNFAAALVCEVEIESNAAAAVEELIDAIGDVTLAKAEQIIAAAEAAEALSEGELAGVDNLDTLISAVEELVELALEVEAVNEAIANLNEESEAEEVMAVQDAYDALTDEQKTYIEDVAKLEAAVEAAEVELVNDAIEALPEDADKETVLAVKAAYDALSDAQKALITNYAKLEAAVKAVAAPETGDMTPVALLSGLMSMSLLAAAAAVLQLKKQKA